MLIDKIAGNVLTNKKTNFFVFFVTLTTLALYMMYTHSPFYAGHDFFHHWGRLNGLTLALKNGTFPWYINYNGLGGAGYFVKAFYCDITLLPFAIIGLFTNPTVGYQSMILGTTLLCGICSYVAVYKIFGSLPVAFISSILYPFCAYRLLDLYERAAIGEVFTFIFLPIILWGFYEIIKGDYRKWYILAIGYTMIVFSHLISAIILCIPIILFLAIYYKSWTKQPKRIYSLLMAGIATIVLSSYYIFPMLEQMMSNFFYYQARGVIVKGMLYSEKICNFFLILFQAPMLQTEFTFKIGLSLSLFVCIRIFVRQKSKMIQIADWFVIVGLVITLMTTNIFPWMIFPFSLLSVMQFTFRLLIFPSLLFAIAGSIYLCGLNMGNRMLMIAIALIVVMSAIMIRAEGKNYRRSTEPITYTLANTQTMAYGNCEYLPHKVLSMEHLVYDSPLSAGREDTQISNYQNDGGVISFYVNLQKPDVVTLPIVYYKGYVAEVNGEPIKVGESNRGMIELSIDKSGTIIVYYAGTMIQKVSTVVSLIAIITLCVYIYRKRKKCGKS